MKILYDSESGEIHGVVNKDINIHSRYRDYPPSILDTMDELHDLPDNINPQNYSKFRVINNSVVELLDYEFSEFKRHGRILTEEERILERLKPSNEEIQKAEETLKLLELLQEVM